MVKKIFLSIFKFCNWLSQYVTDEFSLLIDLSELEILDKNVKLFSFNKFNLISFYEKDHGDRDGSSLTSWVKQNLKKKWYSKWRYKNKNFMLPKNIWICI